MKYIKSKIIISLFLFTLVFLLNVQEVTASSIPPHIKDMSVKQGWLARNDYSNSFNPPACKVREPTPSEIYELKSDCNSNDFLGCTDEGMDKYIKSWGIHRCAELGVEVYGAEGNSYFRFPDENEEEAIEANTANEDNIQDSIEAKPVELTKEVASKTNNIIYIVFQKIVSFFKKLFY